MEYEVEVYRPRGRPKRTRREVVENDCKAHKLYKEDAMDCSRWRKLIKDVWWSWRMFLLVMAHPGSSGKRAVKRLCVYVYMAILFSAMHSVIVLYFPSKLLTSTMSFKCRMSVCGACQQSAIVPQRGGHCRSSQGCTRGPGSRQCIPLSHTRLRCRLPHDAWANTHTHTHLTALCPGLPGWASIRKVKPTWILLKQETVSGSGISWAICKSALRSR